MPFPPQTRPALPSFNTYCNDPSTQDRCEPTDFDPDVLDDECSGGGEVVDPGWVTVEHWDGPQDYVVGEGEVKNSRVARKDWARDHNSHDVNIHFETDRPYHYLVSTVPESADAPYELEAEWERDDYPEFFWPTVGDRVSVFGYWNHDCAHEGFYTEIHPAVGVATHRARPVELPASEGLGDNVVVPGIVSDVWFNRDGGETTEDCSQQGLHQPGAGNSIIPAQYCLPVPVHRRP